MGRRTPLCTAHFLVRGRQSACRLTRPAPMQTIDTSIASAIASSVIPTDGTLTAVSLTIALFPTAKPTGPAYGMEERTTWGAFAARLRERREGDKDGPSFVAAR